MGYCSFTVLFQVFSTTKQRITSVKQMLQKWNLDQQIIPLVSQTWLWTLLLELLATHSSESDIQNRNNMEYIQRNLNFFQSDTSSKKKERWKVFSLVEYDSLVTWFLSIPVFQRCSYNYHYASRAMQKSQLINDVIWFCWHYANYYLCNNYVDTTIIMSHLMTQKPLGIKEVN